MDVHEFYAPFAHIPGRFEWCRIRSPTHGVFDTFIVLGKSTAVPADVYIHDDTGAAFMADRYPECRTYRLPHDDLTLLAPSDRRVVGVIRAEEGPVRGASMVFAGHNSAPEAAAYGDVARPVWGGRWSCEGVDLEVPASVHGHVEYPDRIERFDGEHGTVTLGSFGCIRPLAHVPEERPT